MRKCLAFTLIEMLVVIAILGILASLLMPSLQKALESTRTLTCMNNQKQIYTAMLGYASDYSGYLPNRTAWGPSPYGWTSNCWVVHVSEYTGKAVKRMYLITGTVFVCPKYKSTSNLNGTTNGWIGNNYAVNPRINSTMNFARMSLVKKASEVILMGDGGIFGSNFCLCRYDQNHYSVRHGEKEFINVVYADGHSEPLMNIEYTGSAFSSYTK